MLGNWTVGTGVLAPAGLLDRLADAFDVSIAQSGALMWSGAIVLGLGAPLLAWLLGALDRRLLLAGSFGLYVVGYGISIFATDFAVLLGIRLVTVLAAAVYTPQTAAVVGLIVPAGQRAAGVAFVFMGWSLAAAFGMPLASMVGAWYEWQAAYASIAALAALQGIALLWVLPRRLFAPSVSLQTWRSVGRSSPLRRILAVTVIMMTAQFVVVTYLAPELKRMLDAGDGLVAALLSLYGVCGVLGNLLAARLASRVDPTRILQLALSSIAVGLICWANAFAQPFLAIAGIVFWGLGGFAAMSVQQGRLITTAPVLAPATAALNSSALYVGQAIGGMLAALLIANDLNPLIGWSGAALTVIALVVVWRDTH